jgi:hypothetical protein
MARLIFLPIAETIESGTYLLYDGACGTGGMLTVAEETLQELAAQSGKQVATHLYGQEINAETYAYPPERVDPPGHHRRRNPHPGSDFLPGIFGRGNHVSSRNGFELERNAVEPIILSRLGVDATNEGLIGLVWSPQVLCTIRWSINPRQECPILSDGV